MNARLETIPSREFVGARLRMSFAADRTFELWKGFMPRKSEIKAAVGADLFSIEVYPEGFFDTFDPTAPFEKWAAVEVSNLENIPEDFDKLTVTEGLYAVFIHRGSAIDASQTYKNIFETWLPGSGFRLDVRPHFAVMGAKYKNDDLDSEEEIWIPISRRLRE